MGCGKQREEGGKGGTRSPEVPLEAERKEQRLPQQRRMKAAWAWRLVPGLDLWNRKIRACCLQPAALLAGSSGRKPTW